MFMYLFRQLMHCLKKNMNFTSDEEINIPFIRLTSHNDVFKCIGFRQTFCNNHGIYFFTFKTSCYFLYKLGGPYAMKIYGVYLLTKYVLLKSLVNCQVI